MCEFCGKAIRDGRPYTYCSDPDCVAQGLWYRQHAYALVLVPKSGFTYVERTDVSSTGGKSSGR